MRAFFFVLAAFLLSSCCCTKTAEKVSDSLSVRVVERVTEIWDTVVVEVPTEKMVNVTTDTVSVLTAELATSTAKVSGGVLRHTLEVSGGVEVVYRDREVVRDSIVYVDRKVAVVHKQREPYTALRRWVLLLVVLLAGFVFLRFFRKI